MRPEIRDLLLRSDEAAADQADLNKRAVDATEERAAAVTGADEDLLCATAGYLPPSLATALQDAEKLRLVRLLIAKLEQLG